MTFLQPTRRIAATVVTALALLASVMPSAHGDDSSTTARAAAHSLREAATVTLVTGDTVTVMPAARQPRIAFRPRPGGTDSFSVQRSADGVYVIPRDVTELVPGVLDRELFNVTGLVEMGLDDTHASTVPLIVEHAGRPGLAGTTLGLGGSDNLPSIHSTAGSLSKNRTTEFGADLAGLPSVRRQAVAAELGGATRIWLDRVVTATSTADRDRPEAAEPEAWDPYLSQVGAPAAWERGLHGAGTTVAVLDTGVDQNHPALAGQVEATGNFTDSPTVEDVNGHGTHVASLAVGTGAGSAGTLRGIAYDADLLSGKVVGDDGRGQLSWIIAGMEWAVGQGADVVNLSVGARPTYGEDPLVESLEELASTSDALFVVAAGNYGGIGSNPGTVASPGVAPSALTVAAVIGQDTQASFSSEGPSLDGSTLKPDIAAPGQEIPGASVGARQGDPDLYRLETGTSQATPIVSGAAALMWQQHPTWSAGRVKAALIAAAHDVQFGSAWTVGSGRIDVDAATSGGVRVDVGPLDFGAIRYPDESQHTRPLALTNDSGQPVTLTASHSLADLTKTPAPEAAIHTQPSSLTLAPGEQAQVDVTVDPGQLSDGPWQGILAFSDEDGQEAVRLPLGVYDEPPTLELDLSFLDRNGDPWNPENGAGHPYADPTVQLFNTADGSFRRLRPDETGHVSTRVPAGSYQVFSRIVTPASGSTPETITVVAKADVEVGDDTALVLSAQGARPLSPPTVAGHRTRFVGGAFIYTASAGGASAGRYSEATALDPRDIASRRLYYLPTDAPVAGGFEALVRWRVDAQPLQGGHRPYRAIDLLIDRPEFSAELSPHLTERDMRTLVPVRTTVHPVARQGTHELWDMASTSMSKVETFVEDRLSPPMTRTVLTNAGAGQYRHQSLGMSVNRWNTMETEPRILRPGQRLSTEFGGAVHAAAQPPWFTADRLYFEGVVSDGRHRTQVRPELLRSAHVRLLTSTGRELGRSGENSGFFTVPAGRVRLRLVHEQVMRSQVFHMADRTRTIWDFTSTPSEADPEKRAVPPLFDVDYGPVLATDGAAPRRGPLTLRLGFERGGVLSPRLARVTSARLWWSTGSGWHRVGVHRQTDRAFRATVTRGDWRRGRAVSLRLVARDQDGNRLDQTAFGLIPTP